MFDKRGLSTSTMEILNKSIAMLNKQDVRDHIDVVCKTNTSETPVTVLLDLINDDRGISHECTR